MATTATNTLLNINMITAKALAILHQKLNFIGSINRVYDDSFANSGAKIGSTLRIRLPVQFTVSSGPTLSVQNTVETNTSLTVSTQKHVDFSFYSSELTMNIDDFAARYLEPACAVLAANVESDALSMLTSVYNSVNGQGSAQTFKNILQARKILLDNLAPQDRQWLLRINTQDNVDVVDSLKGLFQQSTQIGRQYTDGVMGLAGGFEWAENTFLSTYTRGAETSGYLTNGATQTGASLIVDTGTGAGNAGDIFTIAGVYRVHPETKASTGVLQQFVLTAAYAGGGGTMAIAPSIVASGATQNVSNSAADNSAITWAGSISTATGQSVAYHPDAFTFATADLVMPGGVDMASRAQKDGLSIRVVRQYDINNDVLPCRLDLLYGYACIRPQLAVRLFAN
jgi:P22 coat protein - gene protein 5